MAFLPPNQQRQSTEGNQLRMAPKEKSGYCGSAKKW